MNNDRLRCLVNIVFALTQILAGALPRWPGIGEDIATRSNLVQTPITPAGYTFSIWGVIFFGWLVYAVYQALPKHRGDRLLRRVGWLTAGAFFGNTLWTLECIVNGFTWQTLAIILATTLLTAGVFWETVRVRILLTASEFWFVMVPTGLLFGWLCVASAANVAMVIEAYDLELFGLTPTGVTLLLLALATLVAVWVTVKSHGERPYAYAVIWGIVGIASANGHGKNPTVANMAWLMAGVVFVALYADKWKKLGRTLFRPKNAESTTPVVPAA